MSYSIEKINEVIKGKIIHCPDPQSRVTHLLIDSRQIVFPEGSLFFAFKGQRQDGHEFIAGLYELGVKNFVLSQPTSCQKFAGANFLSVEDPYLALQALAAYHRSQFKLPVIGITGSNGKTIIKEWLFQLLQPEYKIVRSPKSFNSQIGVPLSVWEIQAEHDLGLFEAGISKVGEMLRLAPIIDCTIGLFTNIGAAHSEGFASKKEKLQEKLHLFEHAHTIIYCKDDPLVKCEMARFREKKIVAWSRTQEADLQITSIELQNHQTEIRALYLSEEIHIIIPFIDPASIDNAIHCWLTLLLLGYDNQTVHDRIARLDPVAMRLEVLAGVNNCTIVNDSYNSDLNSLAIALNFAHLQSHHSRRSIILSDILQTGIGRDQLYRTVAQLLIEKDFQRIVGIGTDVPQLRNNLPASIRQDYYSSTAAFLDACRANEFSNETVLLKGARHFAFERIANRLVQQLHKTVLEVDLNALIHNLRTYNGLLKSGTKLMVMVKASAYGSGSIEVARLLASQRVDYLAVAYVDEGIELRKAGIQLPILVLNPEEASFDAMLTYRLEPEIYTLDLLERLVTYISANQEVAIHLKLDTGMHRLGFEQSDLPMLIDFLIQHPTLQVRSIFTHLAASDMQLHDDFTKQQAQKFQTLYNQISDQLGYRPLRHILNTSGIVRFPQYQMEMVRLGIGLYGIDSSNIIQNRLRVVNTLKASISQIKKIPAHATVGYNRSGRVRQSKRIATISIGYADGLMRRAGNGKYAVWLHHQKAPIIGNICMDMCMVDISHIDQAKPGDEVEVFGKNLPVQELAEVLDTIPYEIFTSISRRVKRSYFQE